MTAIKVKRGDIAHVIRATFPEYNGRKFRVQAATEVGLYDLNWSGGTRSQYRACTLTGEPLGGVDKYNAMAPWRNAAEGVKIPIVPGACIVEHSNFCGKDMGLRVYVHPDDIPRYLSGPLA